MTRIGRSLLLALTLTVVYIIWHPEPTRQEILVRHLWVSDGLQPTSQSNTDSVFAFPFRLEERFGFVDSGGGVLHSQSILHGVGLGPRRAINYPSVPEMLVVMDTAGGFDHTIPVGGYPRFLGDRLFTVSLDGGVLTEWSDTGRELWSVGVGSPIIDMAAGKSLVAVARASGGPLVIDGDGVVLSVEMMDVDQDTTVLGVAISPDETRVAAMIGSDPSSILVFQRVQDRLVPHYRRALSVRPGQASLLEFGRSSETVHYQAGSRHVVLDLAATLERSVASTMTETDMVALPHAEMHLILSVGDTPDPTRGFVPRFDLTMIGDDGVVPVSVGSAGARPWLSSGQPAPGSDADGPDVATPVVLSLGNRLMALAFQEG